MRYFSVFLYSILAGGLMMQSCTKIDAPYAAAKHGNIKDTVLDWDTVSKVRRVLLEDYTGHKCVNCPTAAVTAHGLEANYHGKLLVMAVHAGYYAIPGTGSYALDLRSTASEEWNTDFKLVAYPSGMVNRKDFGSGNVLGPDKWSDNVASIINTAPDAQILISNSYDSTSRTLNSTIYAHFLNQLTGSYTMTVCILEDDILGWQKNSDPAVGTTPDIENYVFNDVNRGSLNSSKGEILTESVNTASSYVGRFKTVLNSGCVASNCKVLVFISKADSREIIQAETKMVVTPFSK
jgi:hypothetical protein